MSRDGRAGPDTASGAAAASGAQPAASGSAGGSAAGDLAPIPDLLRPGIRLLLVGINPGVRSAQMSAHFAGPGNRFWPALHTAGITPERLTPDRQHELLDLGIGITNLAERPSARADELTRDELRAGAHALEAKVAALRPRAVAVLGLTAYRVAFAAPSARGGRQPGDLAGAALYLLPNPSGLNAHTSLAAHAGGLREAALAAGLTVAPGPVGG